MTKPMDNYGWPRAKAKRRRRARELYVERRVRAQERRHERRGKR